MPASPPTHESWYVTKNSPRSTRSRENYGAGDRARTGTSLTSRDFKSRASANSATPAYSLHTETLPSLNTAYIVYHTKRHLSIAFSKIFALATCFIRRFTCEYYILWFFRQFEYNRRHFRRYFAPPCFSPKYPVRLSVGTSVFVENPSAFARRISSPVYSTSTPPLRSI